MIWGLEAAVGRAWGLGELVGVVGGRGHLSAPGGAALGQDAVRKGESEALQEGKALNHSGLGHWACVPTASLSGVDEVCMQETLLLPPRFLPLFKKKLFLL